jgi:hypothetical protein
LQAAKNKCQKRDTNSENECCTQKQKRPPPTYQNPWPAAKNNFFVQLRDLPMEKVEIDNGGKSTRTPEQMRVRTKVGHLPSYLHQKPTSSASRENCKCHEQEVLPEHCNQNPITSKSMVDYNAIQKFLTERNVHFLKFYEDR